MKATAHWAFHVTDAYLCIANCMLFNLVLIPSVKPPVRTSNCENYPKPSSQWLPNRESRAACPKLSMSFCSAHGRCQHRSRSCLLEYAQRWPRCAFLSIKAMKM